MSNTLISISIPYRIMNKKVITAYKVILHTIWTT